MTRPAPARIAGLTPLAVLAACLLLTVPASQAQESATEDPASLLIGEEQPEPAIEELETVVVYGGQARPQMWKVSRGDHVLWVVGNRAAPAGATWRMDELEARLAESKLVQFPGTAFANPDIGLFRALTLIRSAFKAAKNPDNQTLKDVLSAETYTRWRSLKTTYVGRDNDIEKWRPSIALAKLEEKISDKLRPKHARSAARPPMGPMLQPLVEKAAKKKRVKVRTMPRVENKVEVKNIRDMLKSAHKVSLVDEQCVADYLNYLEQQVQYWKLLADGGEGAEAPRRLSACNEADMYIRKVRAGEIPDSTGFVKLLDQLEVQDKLAKEQLDAEWIEAAEAALKKNTSTIALVSMINLKGDRSYIDKLRALGYTVEEPPGAP
jgi:hypothetical protein